MSGRAPFLATYRLQLHADFGFADARRVLPYLQRLGVSHVYLSPILKARSGSQHGYDVVDPARLNPELGTVEDFRTFVDDVHDRGMGVIVDIVPNHMAIGSENPYWTDVLTHGMASRYAGWFDIDWDARGQRVVIPILGDRLNRVIASGELALVLEREERRLVIRYHEHTFPLDPGTIPFIVDVTAPGESDAPAEPHELEGILMRLRMVPTRAAAARSAKDRASEAAATLDQLFSLIERSDAVRERFRGAIADFAAKAPRGPVRLRALLGRQAYRLSYWRREAREINYRRFFTISHLVGVRQEHEAVFAATHGWIAEAVAQKLVDGVRVDHVDGLYDPAGYVQRLDALLRGAPVWIEKILSAGEELPPAWPVAGTTGYDFLNQVEELFIDPEGHPLLEHKYRRFTGRRISFQETVRRSKRRILAGHLAADVARLARQLLALLHRLEMGDDLTASDLAPAITETIVHVDRYRTYAEAATGAMVSPNRDVLQHAISEAHRAPHASSGALEALHAVLLDPDEHWLGVPERVTWIKRFEQLCVPVAAKGVEDTAFYVHIPLLSRCEVGGQPDTDLASAADRFHASNAVRSERWPHALLCVSTHDTKRSADVRSRLDVLSERPRPWMDAIRRWHRIHNEHRTKVRGRHVPDPNTIYHIYQALVGIWPSSEPGAIPGADELGRIADRLTSYAIKAAREAKVHTSWIDPKPDFEDATTGFVRAIFESHTTPRFLDDIASFAPRVARWGTWNALSRTALQCTAPGVPDVYQGDETWSLHLVDPDNRGSVDFAARERMLQELCSAAREEAEALFRDLVDHPEDGRIKMYVVHRALLARRRSTALRDGRYRPLAITGRKARHLIAFARELEGEAAITIVPRLIAGLTDGSCPTGAMIWGDTAVQLPDELPRHAWRSEFTGARFRAQNALRVSDLLAPLPVALLTTSSS